MSTIVSNSFQIPANQESGNRYWEGGAFCKTCGYMEGNVINDTIHPIYHLGCRRDCQEVWERQENQVGEYHTYIVHYIENKIKQIVHRDITEKEEEEQEQWYQEELIQDLYETSTGYMPSNTVTQEYEQQRRENEFMGLEEERKRQEDREWDELEIEEAIKEEEEWKQRELFRQEYEREEARYAYYESEDYDREYY